MVFLESNSQFSRYPFEQFANMLKEDSISGADIVLQAPHCYVDSDEFNLFGIDEILKERGIAVKSVTPLPYRYSIAAPSGSIQFEKSIGYFKNCILACKALGSEYMTITASGACYDIDKEELRKNCKASLDIIVKFAEEQGIKVLFGTVMGHDSPNNESTPVYITLDETAELVRAIDSDNFGVFVDIEVISICGETFTCWQQKLKDKIKLIRLTDGNYNGYRIWSKGCLPGEKILNEIASSGFDGMISLQIPGEKYIDNPENAARMNREEVMKMVKKEELWQQ